MAGIIPTERVPRRRCAQTAAENKKLYKELTTKDKAAADLRVRITELEKELARARGTAADERAAVETDRVAARALARLKTETSTLWAFSCVRAFAGAKCEPLANCLADWFLPPELQDVAPNGGPAHRTFQPWTTAPPR